MRDQAVCRPASLAARAAGGQSGRGTLDSRQRPVQRDDRALDRLRQPPRRAEPVCPPVGRATDDGHDAAPLGDQQETPHGVPARRDDRRRASSGTAASTGSRRTPPAGPKESSRTGPGSARTSSAWCRCRSTSAAGWASAPSGFRATIPTTRKMPTSTFADLPKLAKEAKEHGLDEMVVWGTAEGFLLPLPPFFKHLGGDEGFVRAVAECKKLGVNVVPFISVFNAKEKTAARYGLKAVGSENWTYHPEFIPRFTPPYAGAYRCVQIRLAQSRLAARRCSPRAGDWWTWASPRSPGTSISSSRRNRTCSRSPGSSGLTRAGGIPNRPFPRKWWPPWRSPATTSITRGTGTC